MEHLYICMYNHSLMQTLFYFILCGHSLKPHDFIVHLITNFFKSHGLKVCLHLKKKIPTSAPKKESIFISILIYFDYSLQLIIGKRTMRENIFC